MHQLQFMLAFMPEGRGVIILQVGQQASALSDSPDRTQVRELGQHQAAPH